MKTPRTKTKRAIRRGERHGYRSEGKMRREISLAKAHREEIKENL